MFQGVKRYCRLELIRLVGTTFANHSLRFLRELLRILDISRRLEKLCEIC
jgi:hypothetical protein